MWNISSTDFKGASLLQTIILANHPATLKYSLSWVEDRHKLTVFYLNIIATGSMQFRNVRDVLKEEYTNILPVSWICSPPGSRAQTVFNLLLHGPVEISLENLYKYFVKATRVDKVLSLTSMQRRAVSFLPPNADLSCVTIINTLWHWNIKQMKIEESIGFSHLTLFNTMQKVSSTIVF